MELKPDFIRSLHTLLPAEAEALADTLAHGQAVTSVRVNPAKGAHVPAQTKPVPWCPEGFYCPERPQFTFDPELHAGRYYVQDASSMFITHAVRQLTNRPVRYLDLCAAPGGKATAAMTALPDGSVVVANEVVPTRARVLADNIARWGSPSAIVTTSRAEVWGAMDGLFDIVAADVPCSGEGMMRKDPEAVAQWTPALVAQCAERQREILHGVWPALKAGGLLIYSTCTFNRAENEDIIEHLISQYGAEPVAIDTDPAWGIAAGINTDAPCYRFFPHQLDGEGLFMAIVRKPGDSPTPATTAPRRRPAPVPAEAANTVKNWLIGDYIASTRDGIIEAHRPEVAAIMEVIQERVKVLRAGVAVAETKGKRLAPHHELALSTALRTEAFPEVAVDYPTALAYLRGEAITIDAPRGMALITFNNARLGWANNLGNRANNLYPRPLRILSSHNPDNPPSVIR